MATLPNQEVRNPRLSAGCTLTLKGPQISSFKLYGRRLTTPLCPNRQTTEEGGKNVYVALDSNRVELEEPQLLCRKSILAGPHRVPNRNLSMLKKGAHSELRTAANHTNIIRLNNKELVFRSTRTKKRRAQALWGFCDFHSFAQCASVTSSDSAYSNSVPCSSTLYK